MILQVWGGAQGSALLTRSQQCSCYRSSQQLTCPPPQSQAEEGVGPSDSLVSTSINFIFRNLPPLGDLQRPGEEWKRVWGYTRGSCKVKAEQNRGEMKGRASSSISPGLATASPQHPGTERVLWAGLRQATVEDCSE